MKIIPVAVLTFLIVSPLAKAQDLATEHTQILNNIQLVLTAARELQSLVNQAQMIQNEIEQLKSVANYQGSFTYSESARTDIFTLANQGISVSNQIQQILTQMQQLSSALGNNGGTLSDQYTNIEQNTASAIQITLNRINQDRQNYQTEENSLQDLQQKSNNAVGQTQTLQVLNELSLHVVTEMQATKELLNNIAQLEAVKTTQENTEKQTERNTLNSSIQQIPTGNSSFSFSQEN